MPKIEDLREVGAIVDDHIDYNGIYHGKHWLDAARLYPNVMLSKRVGAALAAEFNGMGIDIVVSTTANQLLAAWVARELARADGTQGIVILPIDKYPRSEELYMDERLRKAYASGRRALIVTDAIITGGMVMRMIDVCTHSHIREVVGVGAILGIEKFRRDSFKARKCAALYEVEIFDASRNCPMCKQGTEINPKYGHGGSSI